MWSVSSAAGHLRPRSARHQWNLSINLLSLTAACEDSVITLHTPSPHSVSESAHSLRRSRGPLCMSLCLLQRHVSRCVETDNERQELTGVSTESQSKRRLKEPAFIYFWPDPSLCVWRRFGASPVFVCRVLASFLLLLHPEHLGSLARRASINKPEVFIYDSAAGVELTARAINWFLRKQISGKRTVFERVIERELTGSGVSHL